jgi:hypothetical protein
MVDFVNWRMLEFEKWAQAFEDRRADYAESARASGRLAMLEAAREMTWHASTLSRLYEAFLDVDLSPEGQARIEAGRTWVAGARETTRSAWNFLARLGIGAPLDLAPWLLEVPARA